MWRTAFTVLRKELTDHLRDRRTTRMILIISIALGPLMLIGFTRFIASSEEKSESREIFVHGKENSPEIANFLARQDITIKDPDPDFRELIRAGKHDAVLVIPKTFQEKISRGTAVVELVFDDTRQDSSNVVIRYLRSIMQRFNSEVGSQRLIMRGVSPRLMQVIELQEVNLGTAAQRAATLLFIMSWLTLLGCLSGSTAIAIDVTAGERERGSLEPLLMNPISRYGLVLGKWLAVTCYGLAVPLLTLCGFALTLQFVPMPKVASVLSIGLSQYLSIVLTLFSFAPAMGALEMLIAANGRTFKEAQTSVSYMIMVGSMAPTIAMFAQLKDATWQLFVPMLGQLMVMTRILRGEQLQAMHYLYPFIVNAIICVAAIFLIAKLLTKEKIVFGRG